MGNQSGAMSQRSRQEYVNSARSRYGRRNRAGKSRLLDEVCETLGWDRKHAIKALNNYVSAAGLLAVSEALVIAARFGLDPRVANQVFKASTGRNNTTDRKVEQYMLNRAFDSGFALDLMVKDVGMARDLARELALEAPWLEACRELLGEAAQALGPGADHTSAFAFLEERLTGAGSKE